MGTERPAESIVPAEPPSRRQGRSARAFLPPWLFQLVVTAGFLGLLAWRVDLEAVLTPIRRANLGWALLGVVVFPLIRPIDALRWRLYLTRVGRVPYMSLLGAFLVGNLANSVLPLRMGDLVKIQIVASRHGLSRAGLVTSRLVESVMDGVTFVLMVALGLGLLGVVVGPAPLLWGLVGASLLGLAGALLAGHVLSREPRASRLIRLLPRRWRGPMDDAWTRVRDGLETMRRARLFGATLALNVASWLVQASALFLFGLAFGLDLPVVAYVGVTIAANIVTDVPITFQNFGTYEVVMVEFLALQGVDRADAFAYALITHVLTNLWVLVLGLVAMWSMRLRLGELLTLREHRDAVGQTR
ncbi:MAG: flippase-like domain-containing protein [Dehalococcoidia bacterium]|nr:MAG: flippase-like domain-containing protein [Dehalococcoidia bacterium]